MRNASKMAIMLGLFVSASVIGFSQANAASAYQGSIIYQGGKQQYDRKIEAAAIKRVAAKIGDIRGSIGDDNASHIITDEEITNPKSSQLGFPIIEEKPVDQDFITGSIHIL